MSFTVTMIWMIGTAIAVMLLLGVGFPAMAGAIHRPERKEKDVEQAEKEALAAKAGQAPARKHTLHLRHGH